MMSKLPYVLGDIFAFPVRGGGKFCIGVIAGMPKTGKILLGYFYKKTFRTIPSLGQATDLRASNAIRVWRFGDLSLLRREWPIVGHVSGFDVKDWPSSKFVRGSMRQLVTYANEDPLIETKVEPYEFDGRIYESDGIKGAELVEIEMAKILEKEES